MDAGISGEYPQIMRFVNSLERDQNFFVIRAMSLSRPAGRPGEPAPARLHLAASGRCGGQRLAAHSGRTTPARSSAPQPAGKEGE